MAPKRKRQARLTFEPTGAQSSSQSQFSPANVRYAGSSQVTSSPSKTSSRPVAAKKKKKATQKTIQGTISNTRSTRQNSQASPPSSKPRVSFMPQSQRGGVVLLSDDSDDDDDDDDDDDVLHVPVGRRRGGGATKQQNLPYLESDDDGTDDNGDLDKVTRDTDDDDDDEPIQPSSSRARRLPALESESSSDSDLPAKKRKTIQVPSSSSSSSELEKTPGRRLIRRGQPSSSPTKRHKGHRTPKQKNMELLKRRRAGEKIDQLTSSESDAEEDKRGLYDTASDDSLQFLEDFPDDEVNEENEDDDESPGKAVSSRKPKRQSLVKKDEPGGGDDDSDLDDFVVEDDDTPIGAPDHMNMPYEFTAQSRKPAKEQFPYVVEWLVHNKINPAFDRKGPIYTHAWQKLNDEVSGLATSKFISSAWKVEFYRSLKARPKMEAYETWRDAAAGVHCEACGRSGHPATWKIHFQGQPYNKETLEEVESDSESDVSSRGSVDTQGNELLPTSTEWAVGSTCCSNAETAHTLMHWKHALKEWVEDRLEMDGHMKPAKLKEREKMKAKKRRKAANEIVDKWRADRTVDALYGDFRSVLQQARDKSTSGRGGSSWR